MNKCEYCGKETSNKRYCSVHCRAKGSNLGRKQSAEHIKKRALAVAEYRETGKKKKKSTILCEFCKKKTTNKRFCSRKCLYSFLRKRVKKSPQTLYHHFLCQFCEKRFFNKKNYLEHIANDHNDKKELLIGIELLHKCPYCGKEFISGQKLGGHVVRCKKNPYKVYYKKPKGHKHSEETKKKISDSLKRYLNDNPKKLEFLCSHHFRRASYPEKFFTKVIEKEFEDKNYIKDLPVGKYRIDFAWPNKMLAIEVDGEQHFTPEAQEHDRIRDAFLREKGWTLLRIRWINFYKETQKYILLAKKFIDKSIL